MRKIKFRAWDKTTNTMYPNVEQRLDLFLYNRDMEIMQYTGLLDNQGKEVYDGDILSVEVKLGLGDIDQTYTVFVRWDDKRSGWVFQRVDMDTYLKPSEWVSECNVIGNIYENLELYNIVQNKGVER